jgi:hypothetical protein
VIDIEIGEFKQLAAPRRVFVYPCLYGWPSKYQPISAELAAGLAFNYWHQGADGIYLFNWFPHTYNNSESNGPYMSGLLQQLGDPNVLRRKQTRLMFAADRGRPERSYQYNWLHCILPAPLPTDGFLDVAIRVGEDVSQRVKPTSLELRVTVDNLDPTDVIQVTINDQPVPALSRSDDGALVASVRPAVLTQGVNRVSLRLPQLSERSEAPRTVTAVELHVCDAKTLQ